MDTLPAGDGVRGYASCKSKASYSRSAAHEIGAGVWYFLRLSLALRVAGYLVVLVTSIAREKAYTPKVVFTVIGVMISIGGSITGYVNGLKA